MRTTTLIRKLGLGSALSVLAVATFVSPASAQTSPVEPGVTDSAAQDPAASGSDIVVTGTLIRNPNLTSSTPVTVISDAEITKRAPNTVEELVRALPGVSPGIGSQVNNGSNGTNSVDLRGLGVQRNLVLLDGNRIVPSLANGATDLNVIPLALVSRVDLLTGGASTTYGADAVSGVLNFITRRDFTGLDVRVQNKILETGDARSFRGDLTVGANFAGDRGNAVLSFGYTTVDPVYQTQGYSNFGVDSVSGVASGASGTAVPTRIVLPRPAGTLQVSPDGASLVPTYQRFNFNPYNIFQTPLVRKSVYAATHYDVADGVEFYARGMFSQNTINSIIAPSGVFGNALTIPGQNPYLTAGIRNQICDANRIARGPTCDNNAALPLSGVYRRLVELGPRVSNYENNVYDARVGLKIEVGKIGTLDLAGSYGRSEQTQTQSGYTILPRIQQALNATNATTCLDTSGNCVPLNLFGQSGSISQAQVDFIKGQSTIRINTELSQVHALLSGELLTLGTSSQAISYAVGGEYRKYTYERIPDAFAQDPSALGGAGGAVLPFTGGYDVKEAFGEVIAPLVTDKPFFNELTLEAGIRYSSYNVQAPNSPHFNTTTYKGGATWEPVKGVRLRGNYQRAVRAPNINDLFSPTVTALTNLTTDPCQDAAPSANANLRAVCIAQGATAGQIGAIPGPNAGQINATFVTNTQIRPEKADTFTVGAVFTPRDVVPNLTFSVDYFNIKVNNAITFATPGDAISACFGNITAASATNSACTVIRRNPANGGLSGPSSSTFGLLLPETNLGRLATDGIDIGAAYSRKFGQFGLDLSFNGTWTNHLRFQSAPTSLNRDCVGYYSVNCGPSLGQIQPKYSWQQRTGLSYGPVNASVLWRHIDKVTYEPGLGTLFSGTITNAAGVSSELAGKSYNFNRIPAYNYFDLTFQFDVTKQFNLTLGVQNLFNKQPPIVGGQAGSTTANSGNTFPSTYDPLGRSFNAALRVKF
ncbi:MULTISPECIES: TonB-dependent receptor domain-containing protein [unclassified Sphingomonas]|uniref:TonB-dependent receptor domain-containing protein n=1 Tax=unclassified Sphingomonas TaxID=196159 RepID=UPI0002882967|nr:MULTISPECIES: TonB-dependent receptor [unclassified Sphingomonas]